MTIQCIYCRESITLNQDSEETRKLRIDPHQQMRKHIILCHANKIIEHSQKLGWLLDTLFFDCPEAHGRWIARILALIDRHYEQATGVRFTSPTAESADGVRVSPTPKDS